MYVLRLIEDGLKVFMDDFSLWKHIGQMFRCLRKVLQRWESSKLVLNWEQGHFMVQDGIVTRRPQGFKQSPRSRHGKDRSY